MSGMEWFPLLGLANRARKVVSGEDLVIKEIRNARAKLVLLTECICEYCKKSIR